MSERHVSGFLYHGLGIIKNAVDKPTAMMEQIHNRGSSPESPDDLGPMAKTLFKTLIKKGLEKGIEKVS